MWKFLENFLPPKQREAARKKRKAERRAARLMAKVDEDKANINVYMLENIKAFYEAPAFKSIFDPIVKGLGWDDLTSDQQEVALRYLPQQPFFAMRYLKNNYIEFIPFDDFRDLIIEAIDSSLDLSEELQSYIVNQGGNFLEYKNFLKDHLVFLFEQEDHAIFFDQYVQKIAWDKLTESQQSQIIGKLPPKQEIALQYLKDNFSMYLTQNKYKGFFNNRIKTIKSFADLTKQQREKANEIIIRNAQRSLEEKDVLKGKEKQTLNLRQFGLLGSIAFSENLSLITNDESLRVSNEKTKMSRNMIAAKNTRTIDFYSIKLYEHFNANAEAIAFYNTYFIHNTKLARAVFRTLKTDDEATDMVADFEQRLKEIYWPMARMSSHTGLGALFIPGRKSRFNPFRYLQYLFNVQLVRLDLEPRKALKTKEFLTHWQMFKYFMLRGSIHLVSWVLLVAFSPFYQLGDSIRRNPLLFSLLFAFVIMTFFYPALGFLVPGFMVLKAGLAVKIMLALYTASLVAIQLLKIGHIGVANAKDCALILKDENFWLKRWLRPHETEMQEFPEEKSEVVMAKQNAAFVKAQELQEQKQKQQKQRDQELDKRYKEERLARMLSLSTMSSSSANLTMAVAPVFDKNVVNVDDGSGVGINTNTIHTADSMRVQEVELQVITTNIDDDNRADIEKVITSPPVIEQQRSRSDTVFEYLKILFRISDAPDATVASSSSASHNTITEKYLASNNQLSGSRRNIPAGSVNSLIKKYEK